MWTRLAGLALAVAALTGCGVVDGLFEGDETRLEGEREPVLPSEQAVEPDPDVAGVAIEVPNARANAAWPQPGGTARNNLIHAALDRDLAVAWRTDIGVGESHDRAILGQPVVADGRVYALDARNTVTALTARTGERAWQRTLQAPEEPAESYFGGGVSYRDGRLFVTTGDGRVHALDAGSGETIWTQALTTPVHAAPTVHDGRVLVVTETNRTLALDAEDGTQLWRHEGIEEEAGLIGSGAPAADGGTAVVGYSSGQVFALLMENGASAWSDTLASLTGGGDPGTELADVRGMPVIDRGVVYASSNANRTVAIRLRQGTRAWMREIGGIEMPWVAGNAVFTVSNRARVYAILRENGKVRWATKIPQFTDPDDAEGRISWHGPVLAGGRLLLAGTNDRLVALDPATGEATNRRRLANTPAVSPVVAGNTLYLLGDDGTLTALRAP